MCFRALLYAVSHSIRLGFEGSKLKIVDQKASDGRVIQISFPFRRWLQVFVATASPLLGWNPPVIADAASAGSSFRNSIVFSLQDICQQFQRVSMLA